MLLLLVLVSNANEIQICRRPMLLLLLLLVKELLSVSLSMRR
jgi:hypothetical protein